LLSFYKSSSALQSLFSYLEIARKANKNRSKHAKYDTLQHIFQPMNDFLTFHLLFRCTFAADFYSNNLKENQMKQLQRLIASAWLLMVCTIIYAQKIEVSGTVVDQSGEAIIGATVKEKGTTNGTVTDFDGNFKFMVNSGAKVTVSYIRIHGRGADCRTEHEDCA